MILEKLEKKMKKTRGRYQNSKQKKQSLLDESSISEKLQREVDNLTGELEKAKNDLEKSQGEREEYKNEIFKQQTEKQTLTDTLKRTKEDISSSTERLQQDVDRLMQELEKNKDELKELKEGNKRHELEILEREDEKQTLQETLNTTKDEMSSTKKNLQREVDRLTEALEKNKDELKEETKRHEQEISEREDEKQTLQETLNKTMDEMSSTKKNLQQEVDRLTEALAGKDAETKKLKDALEESQCLRREVVEKKNEELHIAHEENRLLKRKVLVMRMLRSSGLGKTMADIFTKDLTRRLDGRFDSRYVDFSVVHGETTASVLPGVLFVMCMNQPNQIAKHIQDAVLLGTKDRRDVYVLVISNTTKENLAQLTPTRDRVSSELQPSGIIDMAFSSDKGLYECDLNESAINRIQAILNKL